jgi:hypothetical protein
VLCLLGWSDRLFLEKGVVCGAVVAISFVACGVSILVPYICVIGAEMCYRMKF